MKSTGKAKKKTAKKAIEKTTPGKGEPGASREVKTSGLLTREMIKTIEDLFEQHSFLDHIAIEMGVHAQRFREWVRRGEREGEGIYADFAAAVARGRRRAEERELRRLDAAVWPSGKPDWNAAKWKLEKMNPAAYGPRSTTVNVASLERFMKLVEDDAERGEHPGFVSLERIYELGIEALSEEA